jgi:hypothetical protein
MIRDSFPDSTKKFSLLQIVQISSTAHPFCSGGYGHSFCRCKAIRVWSEHYLCQVLRIKISTAVKMEAPWAFEMSDYQESTPKDKALHPRRLKLWAKPQISHIISNWCCNSDTVWGIIYWPSIEGWNNIPLNLRSFFEKELLSCNGHLNWILLWLQ